MGAGAMTAMRNSRLLYFCIFQSRVSNNLVKKENSLTIDMIIIIIIIVDDDDDEMSSFEGNLFGQLEDRNHTHPFEHHQSHTSRNNAVICYLLFRLVAHVQETTGCNFQAQLGTLVLSVSAEMIVPVNTRIKHALYLYSATNGMIESKWPSGIYIHFSWHYL